MKKTTCLLRYGILFLLLTVSSLICAQIPAGYYYQAHGKTGAELKTALHNIIKEASMLKYGSGEGATWEGFSIPIKIPTDRFLTCTPMRHDISTDSTVSTGCT